MVLVTLETAIRYFVVLAVVHRSVPKFHHQLQYVLKSHLLLSDISADEHWQEKLEMLSAHL